MWYQQRERRSKYNATSPIFNGEIYHSKFEAGYAQGLAYRMRAGDIKSWRRQVRMPLDVNGHHICNYIVDFEVTHNDGLIEYVEVKGFETEVWRLKWKLFEVLMKGKPDIRLTVVK